MYEQNKMLSQIKSQIPYILELHYFQNHTFFYK